MEKNVRVKNMTFILPKHFLEVEKKNIEDNDIFYFQYSTQNKNKNLDVRITTHCMILLQEGSKIIHTQKNNIHIEKEELLLMTQNNYFMSEILTESNVYRAILIYFDDKFIVEFIKKYKIPLSDMKKSIVKINYANDDIFMSNIDLLKKYIESNVDSAFVKLKLEEILLYSLKYDRLKTISFLNDVVSSSSNRVQFILESNLDIIQSVEDMCKLTRLTASSLRNYMKKMYDINPKTWLDKKRLQRAVVLLKNTDKSIEEISTDCGYSSVSWFISKFKDEYNSTPKQFRYKL